VTSPGERPPAVTHCPYCGHPLGSFFGHRMVDGNWCERCQEAFTVTRVGDGPEEAPGMPAAAGR